MMMTVCEKGTTKSSRLLYLLFLLVSFSITASSVCPDGRTGSRCDITVPTGELIIGSRSSNDLTGTLAFPAPGFPVVPSRVVVEAVESSITNSNAQFSFLVDSCGLLSCRLYVERTDDNKGWPNVNLAIQWKAFFKDHPCDDLSILQVCGEHGICQRQNNNILSLEFDCTCQEGYTISYDTCVAVDHCSDNTDNCDSHASCLYDGPGSFVCTCLDYYVGDGKICVLNTDIAPPAFGSASRCNSECAMAADGLAHTVLDRHMALLACELGCAMLLKPLECLKIWKEKHHWPNSETLCMELSPSVCESKCASKDDYFDDLYSGGLVPFSTEWNEWRAACEIGCSVPMVILSWKADDFEPCPTHCDYLGGTLDRNVECIATSMLGTELRHIDECIVSLLASPPPRRKSCEAMDPCEEEFNQFTQRYSSSGGNGLRWRTSSAIFHRNVSSNGECAKLALADTTSQGYVFRQEKLHCYLVSKLKSVSTGWNTVSFEYTPLLPDEEKVSKNGTLTLVYGPTDTYRWSVNRARVISNTRHDNCEAIAAANDEAVGVIYTRKGGKCFILSSLTRVSLTTNSGTASYRKILTIPETPPEYIENHRSPTSWSIESKHVIRYTSFSKCFSAALSEPKARGVIFRFDTNRCYLLRTLKATTIVAESISFSKNNNVPLEIEGFDHVGTPTSGKRYSIGSSRVISSTYSINDCITNTASTINAIGFVVRHDIGKCYVLKKLHLISSPIIADSFLRVLPAPALPGYKREAISSSEDGGKRYSTNAEYLIGTSSFHNCADTAAKLGAIGIVVRFDVNMCYHLNDLVERSSVWSTESFAIMHSDDMIIRDTLDSGGLSLRYNTMDNGIGLRYSLDLPFIILKTTFANCAGEAAFHNEAVGIEYLANEGTCYVLNNLVSLDSEGVKALSYEKTSPNQLEGFTIIHDSTGSSNENPGKRWSVNSSRVIAITTKGACARAVAAHSGVKGILLNANRSRCYLLHSLVLIKTTTGSLSYIKEE